MSARDDDRKHRARQEYEAAWKDPTSVAWVDHVLSEMAPKLRDSALVISIVSSDIGDVKFWVETGAAICMDKPIILAVFNGRPIPRKLELVADEIVRMPEGVGADASKDLADAIERVLEKQPR